MAEISQDDRDPVEVLAEEFLELQRCGQPPSIADFAARYPDRAAEIRDLFPAILAMERLKSHCGVPGGSRVSLGACKPERLGDFRLLNEIGRGGMGVVYEALHESLGRHVAVKVLPKQSVRQSRAFQREARTAARLHHTNIVPLFGVGEQDGYHYIVMQRIQGVDLENVLGVLRTLCAPDFPGGRDESGAGDRVGERSNSAIQLARSLVASSAGPTAGELNSVFGQPTTRKLKNPASVSDTEAADPFRQSTARATLTAHAGPDLSAVRDAATVSFVAGTNLLGMTYWRRVAMIGRQVADALQYAHQQRTHHQDIKPANLLLDAEGIVWITDFGLAKVMDDSHASQWGTLAGTLRYMAPEQFSGKSDHRCDIYGLGLTLYELLTLEPAFRDSSRVRLIEKITHERPRAPREICPGIPDDLESIVLKAISRDPSDRYQSAGEFAGDLQRFLEDRPVSSRPLSSLQQFRRWSRRNRAVSLLGAIASIFLLTTAVFAVAQYVQRTRALATEEKLRTRAETERMRAEANLTLAAEAFDDVFGRLTGTSLLGSLDSAMEEPPPDAARWGVVSEKDAAILKGLLAFYDQFAAANEGDLRWHRETARAFRRAGEIQFRLESFADADADFRRALAIYEQLATKEPANAEHIAGVAAIRNQLASLAWDVGRRDIAVEESRAAWQFLLRTPVVLNESPACRLELARAYSRYAITSSQFRGPTRPGSPSRNRSMDPREYVQRAIEIADSLLADSSGNLEYSLTLAESYRYLWGIESLRHKFPEAREAREHAVRILEELVAAHATLPQCRVMLVEVYLLPYRFDAGEYHDKDAPEHVERAIEVASELARRYPQVPKHQALHALSWWASSRAQEKVGHKEAAMVSLEKAIALQKTISQQFPTRSSSRFEMIQFLEDHVRLTRALGTPEQLRGSLEELIATTEAGPESLQSYPPFLRLRSRAYAELAGILQGQGSLQQAQAAEVKSKELSVEAARRSSRSFRHAEPSPSSNKNTVAKQE